MYEDQTSTSNLRMFYSSPTSYIVYPRFPEFFVRFAERQKFTRRIVFAFFGILKNVKVIIKVIKNYTKKL